MRKIQICYDLEMKKTAGPGFTGQTHLPPEEETALYNKLAKEYFPFLEIKGE